MLDIRMQYLNNCASKMVKECRDGISKSGETAKNFFKYANKKINIVYRQVKMMLIVRR